MVVYYRHSWADVEEGILRLINEILMDDYDVDVVLGVSKGGVVVASKLADLLGVDVDLIQLSHWDFDSRMGSVRLKYFPSMSVRGLRVLLVDDVADTGATLQSAKETVMSLGASEVRTAVLDYKVVSSRYKPSYYAYEWSNWVYIIYPWESAEAYRAIPAHELRRIFSDIEMRRMADVVNTHRVY